MMVWLSSYPRSGNTLLRAILNKNFGLKSCSLYDDGTEAGAHTRLSEVVGHQKNELGAHFTEWAHSTSEMVLTKTHELPSDKAKAIYVVRDGRSAVISYYHYIRRVIGIDVDIAEVLLGVRWPGSWSSHVRAWALSNRPDTLIVRYEDLAKADQNTLSAISDFIGCKALNEDPLSFVELQRIFPEFFHRGSDEKNVYELNGSFPALYQSLHGETAHLIGYSAPVIADRYGSLAREYALLKRA